MMDVIYRAAQRATAPEAPAQKPPRHRSQVEAHLRLRGADTARRILEDWDLGPTLTQHPDGGATITIGSDPHLGPAITYSRNPQGLLKCTSPDDLPMLSEWLYWDNPRWSEPLKRLNEHDDRLLAQDMEPDPDPPMPWHAAAILPSSPLEQRERTSILLQATDVFNQLISHLGKRLFLETLQTLAIYTSPDPAVKRMEDDHEHLERICELAAAQALTETVRSPATRRLLENWAHHSWTFAKEYDGEWQHAASTRPEGEKPHHEDNHMFAKRAQNRLNRRFHMARPNSRSTRNPDVLQAAALLNRMTTDHMLDEATGKLLLELTNDTSLTENYDHRAPMNSTWGYNRIAGSQTALADLLKTAPELARLHFHHYARPGERARHPGQLVARIKGYQKLSPSEWRCFQRTLQALGHERTAAPKTVRISARNLAAANRPDAPDPAFKTAATAWHLHEQHQPTNTRDHQAPARREAWIRALNAFLHPKGDPAARGPRMLAQVSDAIAGTITNGGAWGPGTWDQMLRRSQRWHQRRFQTRFKATGQGSWQSALPEHREGALTMTPLTTGAGLRRAAEDMDNCLYSYYQDCRSGRSRIFLVSKHGESEIKAAVQLVRIGNEWELGQVEAPHGGEPPDGATRAAHRLLENYREADL